MAEVYVCPVEVFSGNRHFLGERINRILSNQGADRTTV
jgi:hypothetical protein